MLIYNLFEMEQGKLFTCGGQTYHCIELLCQADRDATELVTTLETLCETCGTPFLIRISYPELRRRCDKHQNGNVLWQKPTVFD